jgi:hypothetical protein
LAKKNGKKEYQIRELASFIKLGVGTEYWMKWSKKFQGRAMIKKKRGWAAVVHTGDGASIESQLRLAEDTLI